MDSAGQVGSVQPTLNRRTKLGVGATLATLVVVFYPGQMVLPLSFLSPLMPRSYGCGSFAVGIVGLVFFGLAFLMSAALIGLGALAVIGVIRRSRIGLVGAVLVNALTISLLLMAPLEFSSNRDPAFLGLYALLSVCALIPAIGLVSLLSPTVFGSWWRSGVPFIATTAAAGLLLVPGVVGLVALGAQIDNMSTSQPAASPAVSTRAAC
jgi:hypothetical protein